MKLTWQSFKGRIMVVMCLFAMIPIGFFGGYAYNNLSESRQGTIEKGMYLSFNNDLEHFKLWLDSKRATIIADGKLHMIQAPTEEIGKRENRVFHILYEGTEAYQHVKREAIKNGDEKVLITYERFSGAGNVPDARTVLFIYLKDYDPIQNKAYYIKEEIHLKEVINALETSLNDRFTGYDIFAGNTLVYASPKEANLDSYAPYYNRGSYSKQVMAGNYYMGIYSGSDELKIYVSVYRNYTEAVREIQSYRSSFFLKVIFISLLGAIVALRMAKKMNSPIETIKLAVGEILEGRYDKRIESEQNDEFGQLYEAFNQLAQIETGNYKRMVESNVQIGEKNTELIAVNHELEKSYEQLSLVKAQLDLSKSKQEALIHNIGELIWTMDQDGLVTFVNQAVKEKLGYEMADFEGESIFRFISSFDNAMTPESFIEQIRFLDLDSMGVYFKRSDSEEKVFMLLSTKRVVVGNGGISVQCFARNLSDDWLLHHLTMKRNKEMEITGQISWVLANNIDLEELIEEIRIKIEQLIHPDLCLIGLVEESEIQIAQIGGAYGRQIGKIKLAVGDELFIEMLGENHFIRGEKLHQHFRVANESVYYAIADYVILPFKFDEKVTGFFAMASGKHISDSDLKVLQIISNQSAVAIDKAKLYKTLKEDYLNTIRVLATAVEAKDAYTEGHSNRVSKFARLIAEQITDDEQFADEIEISGVLHDIGKIGIYDKILTKQGRLDQNEYEAIQEHPAIGYKIIAPIELSQTIIDGVLLHHKRFDLGGYPLSESILDLPLSAGIIGVADAVDAMTSTRSYSTAKDMHYAVNEIKKHAGTQFHPVAAEAFVKLYETQFEALQKIVFDA